MPPIRCGQPTTKTCNRMHRSVFCFAFAIAVAAGAAQDNRDRSLEDLLRRHLRFSSSDMNVVQRGGAAARTLESSDDGDVVTAGLIRLSVTPAFFVDRLRDISRFKADAAVLQIGQFSQVPTRR